MLWARTPFLWVTVFFSVFADRNRF